MNYLIGMGDSSTSVALDTRSLLTLMMYNDGVIRFI